jgi:hypothetical protein
MPSWQSLRLAGLAVVKAAFSGIASEFQLLAGDRYIAGRWEVKLVDELLLLSNNSILV